MVERSNPFFDRPIIFFIFVNFNLRPITYTTTVILRVERSKPIFNSTLMRDVFESKSQEDILTVFFFFFQAFVTSIETSCTHCTTIYTVMISILFFYAHTTISKYKRRKYSCTTNYYQTRATTTLL